MMTYAFRLLKFHDAFPEPWGGMIGDIVEVELPITAYDAFKAKYVPEYLERYMDDTPSFAFDKSIRPDGQFMGRMSQIRDNVPGAQNMFDNAKWQPHREW